MRIGEKIIKALREEDLSCKELAIRLGRTELAIRSEIHRLRRNSAVIECRGGRAGPNQAGYYVLRALPLSMKKETMFDYPVNDLPLPPSDWKPTND